MKYLLLILFVLSLVLIITNPQLKDEIKPTIWIGVSDFHFNADNNTFRYLGEVNPGIDVIDVWDGNQTVRYYNEDYIKTKSE